MIRFELMGNLPVMSVQKVAEIVGKDEDVMYAELAEGCECGVFLNGTTAVVEFDDLFDFLEENYEEAFAVIFG